MKFRLPVGLPAWAAAGALIATSAAAQQVTADQPVIPLGGVQPAPQLPTAAADIYSDGPASAHLLGDFDGMRTSLHQAGIDLRADLISEFAGNPTGGLKQAGRDAGQFDFGADFDLGKLGIDPNGVLHVTFNQRWGQSLSQSAIGNLVSVQEIYGGGQDFRLSELSLEQSFLDQHINIKVGRVSTETDFANSPVLWDHASLYCQFQNNGICGTPAGMATDSGYASYPVATWGGRIRVAPTTTTFVQTGIYAVNPTLADSSNGLKISSSGDTGAFIPIEFGWRPGHAINGLPTDDGPLPGDYRIGAYYDTSRATAPLQNLPGRNVPVVTMQSFSGRYGFYVTAAQTLWRVAGDTPGDTRSFSVFGAVDVGDPQTSLYRVYAEVGAVLKGTFPGRDDDTIGFAVTDTEVNQSRAEEESMLLSDGVAITGTQTREVAFELNYAAAVYRGVSIEPGVQVVLHPDALNEIPDALVFDLRTAVKF
jgi:porin